jgi:REP element-mobilizing transposase RayT
MNNAVIEMEVMPGHVHLLADVNPKSYPFYVINRIIEYTFFILKNEFPTLKKDSYTMDTF